jgi:hypothetical protein
VPRQQQPHLRSEQKSGINSCFNGYIKNSRSTAAIATLFTATATTKEPQHEGNNNKATTPAATVEAEKTSLLCLTTAALASFWLRILATATAKVTMLF